MLLRMPSPSAIIVGFCAYSLIRFSACSVALQKEGQLSGEGELEAIEIDIYIKSKRSLKTPVFIQ